MLEPMWHDIRVALRSIRRAPAFSLVVISTIALAIGANTALFSLVNGLVLKSLPVREPATLVALTPVNERGTGAQFIYEATLRHMRAIQRPASRSAFRAHWARVDWSPACCTA
jgi:hypothetical protein